MPIFEYMCEDCGTSFEKLVRRPEANGLACPSCGHRHLRQQFSVFAARATTASASTELPACPSGMCRTPELCGRN